MKKNRIKEKQPRMTLDHMMMQRKVKTRRSEISDVGDFNLLLTFIYEKPNRERRVYNDMSSDSSTYPRSAEETRAAWRELADELQRGPEWMRMNGRKSENVSRGGFGGGQRWGGKWKNGRVDKNRRGWITQERISRFLPLQFAFFMKGMH